MNNKKKLLLLSRILLVFAIFYYIGFAGLLGYGIQTYTKIDEPDAVSKAISELKDEPAYKELTETIGENNTLTDEEDAVKAFVKMQAVYIILGSISYLIEGIWCTILYRSGKKMYNGKKSWACQLGNIGAALAGMNAAKLLATGDLSAILVFLAAGFFAYYSICAKKVKEEYEAEQAIYNDTYQF